MINKHDLPFQIVWDADEAEKINIDKLWEVIDSFGERIPEIFHLRYHPNGEPTHMSMREVSEITGLTATPIRTKMTRGFRYLRYPYNKRKYLETGTRPGTTLKDFTTRELLNELERRTNEKSLED